MREGIYITNPAGEILDANPTFLEMFGVESLRDLRRFRAADLFVDPELRRLEAGRQAGDEVLVKVSRFLMRQVRAEDPVVRFGGDEFVLLLLGSAGDFTADAARRFRSAIEASVPVPLSFGWARREDQESLEQTIARADRQLIQVRIDERGDRRFKISRREVRKRG